MLYCEKNHLSENFTKVAGVASKKLGKPLPGSDGSKIFYLNFTDSALSRDGEDDPDNAEKNGIKEKKEPVMH